MKDIIEKLWILWQNLAEAGEIKIDANFIKEYDLLNEKINSLTTPQESDVEIFKPINSYNEMPKEGGYYFGFSDDLMLNEDLYWFSTVGTFANKFQKGVFRHFECKYWLKAISRPDPDKQSEWISVKDKAPQDLEVVIIGNNIGEWSKPGYRTMGGHWYDTEGSICHVTHWQPIPTITNR